MCVCGGHGFLRGAAVAPCMASILIFQAKGHCQGFYGFGKPYTEFSGAKYSNSRSRVELMLVYKNAYVSQHAYGHVYKCCTGLVASIYGFHEDTSVTLKEG